MRRGRTPVKLSEGSGTAVERVAELYRVSHMTLRKILAVCEAAEAEPERFAHLVEGMDRSGNVHGAYTKLRRARDEARILRLAPAVGRYRALVVDPPWESDWLSDSLGPAYATMTPAEIFALPVAGWADEACHLYLWTTNNFLPVAVEAMRAWGFEHKTVLTWVKPHFGQGHYFRNATEHVLFGLRGELPTRSRSIQTHFSAPVGEHSEKPEVFYGLVRASSFPPFGEAFQRRTRPDFHDLYRPAPAEQTGAAEQLEAAE